MSTQEMLSVLLLQLRNNFALTEEEAQIIAQPKIYGGGTNV